MTDDTKVDTSDWVAVNTWVPCNGGTQHEFAAIAYADDRAEIIGTFEEIEHRDACLHAIQSLPKVTEERDAAVEILKNGRHAFNDLNKLGKTILDFQNVWLDQARDGERKAKAERDSLSARVRELTDALTRMVDHFSLLPPDMDRPGSVMHQARTALRILDSIP